ncbi:MAG: hypothetical protein AB7L09_01765 [Nitrospira sp.]
MSSPIFDEREAMGWEIVRRATRLAVTYGVTEYQGDGCFVKYVELGDISIYTDEDPDKCSYGDAGLDEVDVTCDVWVEDSSGLLVELRRTKLMIHCNSLDLRSARDRLRREMLLDDLSAI